MLNPVFPDERKCIYGHKVLVVALIATASDDDYSCKEGKQSFVSPGPSELNLTCVSVDYRAQLIYKYQWPVMWERNSG